MVTTLGRILAAAAPIVPFSCAGCTPEELVTRIPLLTDLPLS